ncbi:MAG: hypothetical protein MUF11_03205, partial [Beijerinckiaceae bacterium]|nr:hypothetical protein [Beijerinckiaceae bacterium]
IVAHARAMADFDVLCLQEVADNFPELNEAPEGNQFRRFAELLPGFQAIEGVALETRDAEGRPKRFGNCRSSRFCATPCPGARGRTATCRAACWR